MFIETRTTHTEVLDDIFKEVSHQANSVISQVRGFKAHPTHNTKTGIRQELWALQGMVSLARRVSGNLLPAEIEAKYDEAHAAVKSL